MSKNVEDIKKYREFLIALQNYADMARSSKGVINYNIGKINLLLNDKQQAKVFFINSIIESKNTVEDIIKYDKEVEKFMLENGILK